MKKLLELRHPEYENRMLDWEKFRFTYEGGRPFVNRYLSKFSVRENSDEFNLRRSITFAPAHAKAAITDIKNAIYQRMVDITRTGGSDRFRKAIAEDVDFQGNSLNNFIGRIVLPEMLVMSKVGVLIDNNFYDGIRTLANPSRPYLSYYKAEDIISWAYDTENRLTALLLKECIDVADEETGLIVDQKDQYRLYRRLDNAVSVVIYSDRLNEDNIIELVEVNSFILPIPEIPFVIMSITESLLTDVADYQIALLNLDSSILDYALKSNYPFFIEQYDPMADFAANQFRDTGDSTVDKARDQEHEVGPNKGLRYKKGLESPAFIHPSSEPLKAGLDLAEAYKNDIRLLVNLNVSALDPQRQSKEVKEYEDRTLEAGLSYIGTELQYGENQIARFWAMFENERSVAEIKYPTSYNLKSDEDRIAISDKLKELMTVIPSKTFGKKIAKMIGKELVGHRVTLTELTNIESEIDSAPVVTTDPEILIAEHEAGLVSDKTASMALGFDENEHIQAQKDRAKRVAEIVAAQNKAAARGAPELDATDNTDKPVDAEGNKKPMRGEGK